MPSPLRVRDRFRSIFNKKRFSKADLKASPETSGASQPAVAAPTTLPLPIPVISVTKPTPTPSTPSPITVSPIATSSANADIAPSNSIVSSKESPDCPENAVKTSDTILKTHQDVGKERDLAGKGIPVEEPIEKKAQPAIQPEVGRCSRKTDDQPDLGRASDAVEPSGISVHDHSRDSTLRYSIPGAYPDEGRPESDLFSPEQLYVPPPLFINEDRLAPHPSVIDESNIVLPAFRGARAYGGANEDRASILSAPDSVSDYDNHSITSSIGDKHSSTDQSYHTPLYAAPHNNAPHTPPKSPDWLDHSGSGSESSTPHLESHTLTYAQNYRAMVDESDCPSAEPITPTRQFSVPHPVRVRESKDSVLMNSGMPPTPDTPVHMSRKDFERNEENTPDHHDNYIHPFADSAQELGSETDGKITYLEQPTTTTHRTIRYNTPIVRETARPHSREIRTEEITREIHTYDIYPVIQPIVKREYLPPKHFVQTENGELHEISKEEAERQRLPIVGRGEERTRMGNEARKQLYKQATTEGSRTFWGNR